MNITTIAVWFHKCTSTLHLHIVNNNCNINCIATLQSTIQLNSDENRAKIQWLYLSCKVTLVVMKGYFCIIIQRESYKCIGFIVNVSCKKLSNVYFHFDSVKEYWYVYFKITFAFLSAMPIWFILIVRKNSKNTSSILWNSIPPNLICLNYKLRVGILY